jgi:hypothetical protein
MADTPTYQVAADNSDIKGTISFSARDDGYYGTIILSNFPEGYIKTSTSVTSPIVEANYETLKIEVLKLGQAYLDELKTDTVDFGILKIVSTAEEPAIRFINYKTEGKIIDHEYNPLPEATIKDPRDNQTTSNTTGDFILEGDYISGSIFDLTVSAEGYGTKYGIKPFDSNKKIKSYLTPIQLNPEKEDLKDDISDELPLNDIQVKAMKLSKTNFEMAQQQAMNKIITTVKTVLIPSILTQLAAFGITKASEALNRKFGDVNFTCPSNLDELNKLIKKKNRLTKQLNNIYKFLNTIKVGVDFVNKTITVAEIALQVSKALAATPGSPSEPAQSIFKKIEQELKKYRLISEVTLMVLIILLNILQRILDLLALLDFAIGKCAIEGALPQEQLTTNLLESTQTQSHQLSPVVTNVNGFDMDVIAVSGGTDGALKQRRAVARNSQGIIMLQGEPSYSSNDQILIDELVYYIQQNDLKA